MEYSADQRQRIEAMYSALRRYQTRGLSNHTHAPRNGVAHPAPVRHSRCAACRYEPQAELDTRLREAGSQSAMRRIAQETELPLLVLSHHRSRHMSFDPSPPRLTGAWVSSREVRYEVHTPFGWIPGRRLFEIIRAAPPAHQALLLHIIRHTASTGRGALPVRLWTASGAWQRTRQPQRLEAIAEACWWLYQQLKETYEPV